MPTYYSSSGMSGVFWEPEKVSLQTKTPCTSTEVTKCVEWHHDATKHNQIQQNSTDLTKTTCFLQNFRNGHDFREE